MVIMKWTPDQVKYLTDNMDLLKPQEIADVVGFSRNQVINKIWQIKNVRDSEINPDKLTEDEIEVIKRLYPTTNTREISRLMHISQHKITNKITHLIRMGVIERKAHYNWTDAELTFLSNNIDAKIEFLMDNISRPKSVIQKKRNELRISPAAGNSEKIWTFDLRVGNRHKYGVTACGDTEEYALNRLTQGYRRVWNDSKLVVEKL